jgi:hypothetical protein
MMGPDQLVDVGPTMLGQVIAGGKNGQLIHYVKLAGKAKEINGEKEKTEPK